ncbi:MAG: cation-translocating P-type ATPase [Lachnospiraceae bacterium]|nr:cation-translocating P-type ATPase [Lachnospiraceae bacterium]
MEVFFNQSAENTAKELAVDLSVGLSKEEAVKRAEKYGSNRLEGGKEKSVFQMAFDQLKDFMVIILMIAAVISIALGEALEGVIILAIVVLNTILGVYQENKASNALKALKEMASPHAKVLRDGQIVEVASSDVVPGDIAILEAGDYIPADMRLIETVNLKVDEAALTGESVPVEKDADVILDVEAGLGDRVNCAYMGTVITYGRGKGLITDIGMQTQMGNIADMLNDTPDESTPLQKNLDNLGKLLGTVCLAICGIIFVLGLLRGMGLFDIFMTSVSLAVAAIPEGLTVVVTVVLAMGMQKMVKCNAIIKRLSAVETLGSTTVICSDKTGTLTQNKMTIQKLYDSEKEYDVSGTGYSPKGQITDENGNIAGNAVSKLIEGALLCNDATYNPQKETIIGDPTEGAMVVLAYKCNMIKAEWEAKYPRLQEIPFDSDRKLMSTFHSINGQNMMYTKGAPDELLRRCESVEIGGKVIALTEEKREEILAKNKAFAEAALRVIGVAYRVTDQISASLEEENNLTFVGLLGMIDPPREEAKQAIDVCKQAGIQVKMITGDHKITASAIGAQLSIVSEGTVEGREINAMTDEQLRECVKHTNIFARVSPEHKVRLVDAVRENGNIAAMTGDGVNDAPSLKHADIGVAMGITGTDVSKEAADMILTDDNFASIVSAVSEGRTIYANIRKVVGFLLSCNIGEILVILLAMLANLPVPLVAIQLLSINLITDAFPAFALGMEKAEPGVMSNPPRDPSEPIVNKKMAIAVLIQSIALAAGTLGSFVYGYVVHDSLEVARSACFFTLVLGELLRAYAARSEVTSVFKMKILENSSLNKCVLISILFLIASIYVPFLNPVFSTVALTLDEMLLALVFAFLPMLGGELAKVLTKKM